MLARAMPSILPPMTIAESLEVTKIYSVRGLLPPETPLVANGHFARRITGRAMPGSSAGDRGHDPAK